MKRSSFLKSLLGIAIAPKIAIEAAENVASAPIGPPINSAFLGFMDGRSFKIGDLVRDMHGSTGVVLKSGIKNILKNGPEIDVKNRLFSFSSVYTERS